MPVLVDRRLNVGVAELLLDEVDRLAGRQPEGCAEGQSRRLAAILGRTRQLNMTAKSHEFEVVLQPEEEGGFSVSVPALPGCHTQGETRDEALSMARDAIEGYLEVLADEGRPLPQPALIERITVAA